MNKDHIFLTVDLSGMAGDFTEYINIFRDGEKVVIQFTSDESFVGTPSGEILHESDIQTEERLYRVFINQSYVEPDTYKVPYDALPVISDGLEEWEQVILPLFMCDYEGVSNEGLLDGELLLSLDDWHMKAFSFSVGNVFSGKFLGQCEKLRASIEVLELDDLDVRELLDRYQLSGKINYWPTLIEQMAEEADVIVAKFDQELLEDKNSDKNV